ncbi:MAG: TetR/AcrR family transcriptional regulator [Clostridia bacterium]|nr:TetR/AcrR family transcriptional regulator [Clostridia bacterium]
MAASINNIEARICDCALQRFTASGYSGVTMEEIARSCGIGKATLYKHFASKEALMLACVDYAAGHVGAAAQSVIEDPAATPVQKLEGIVGAVIHFISHINGPAVSDIRRNIPQAWERIETARHRLIFSNITRIINEGKESGVFLETLEPMLVANILIGAASQITTPEVLEELGGTPGQIFGGVLSVVIGGCLTDAGRAAMR